MDSLQTSLTEFIRRQEIPTFFAPLLRLVAEGEPVPLDRLAAEADLPVDRVESWLRAQRGTDWDERGRLVGFGLTQRPTAHRFVVDDRTLYAFCAADTLIFPPIMGKAATVESTCPATGQRIRLRVTPEAATSVEPTTAVVSQVCLCEDITDIRATVCDHGHFYASAGAAAEWRRDHPDGELRPVREFFTLGLAASRELGWVAAT
ncbi:MAG: organomercurial lyase MerB [Streptosporangiales bacterium]|nr:organomercurial lyase MerB [Streptosporangiales bacterium]